MSDAFINDEDLHAFIDGELDHTRILEIAALVSVSPALAKRVARFRHDREMLARVYQPLADQAIPSRLRAPFARQRLRRKTWNVVTAVGATAAMLAILWAVMPKPDRLVAEALSARSGAIPVQQEFAGDSMTVADARDQLLDNTLALPVKVPNLAQAGYVLTAMAVYPDGAQGHALQLSYQDSHKRLFTVYLRHPVGPDRFDLSRKKSLEVCVWQNEELGVAMVGEMSPKEMLKLASLTYSDLNL